MKTGNSEILFLSSQLAQYGN